MCMLMGLTLSAASGITSPLDSHVILYKVTSPPRLTQWWRWNIKMVWHFETNTEQSDGPFSFQNPCSQPRQPSGHHHDRLLLVHHAFFSLLLKVSTPIRTLSNIQITKPPFQGLGEATCDNNQKEFSYKNVTSKQRPERELYVYHKEICGIMST